MRSRSFTSLAVLATLTALWFVRTPPTGVEIAPAYTMSSVPEAVLEVESPGDPIAEAGTTFRNKIAGYDDVAAQPRLGRAFVSAMDGRLWKLDLSTGKAEVFVDPPLMPSGLRLVPGDDDLMLFCASSLGGIDYPDNESPGVYELRISDRSIRPVLLRVPRVPVVTEAPEGKLGLLYAPADRPHGKQAQMTSENSRRVAFCNDLDVSRDGQRIYFSEPFAYEGAGMGPSTFYEGLSLGRHGRLWLYDRVADEVSLVAQGYSFIDGVLLEYERSDDAQGMESSVLVTETPKFRILRFHLSGESAGRDEEVWQSLPGMPDGLDRDLRGNVWTGMLRDRTPLLTWIHANPWIKPLLLRIPQNWLPQSQSSSILALSPDASTPLYYARHDGSRAAHIAAVATAGEYLYLPSFSTDTPGVHRMRNPLLIND